jgi:hypothetical protein
LVNIPFAVPSWQSVTLAHIANVKSPCKLKSFVEPNQSIPSLTASLYLALPIFPEEVSNIFELLL